MVELFDLIVIGGGLNGAGVARDAAGQGLSVALFEKDDLAEHSSSASAKIIEGGMRDLQFRKLGAVRKALIERERLMRIAPHIIWPLEFRMPHAPRERSAWKIRIDLSLYDHLAQREFLSHSRRLRLKSTDVLHPHYRTAFSYADCWVEDSRLVILNAMDAAVRGAKIFTRQRVLSAQADGKIWHIETQAGQFRARAVVNAAGAWAQQVLTQVMGIDEPLSIKFIKQSYLVTKRLYPEKHAFILRNPDKRLISVVPYERDYALIGASEDPFDGDPQYPNADDHEVDYLCTAVNRYFRQLLKPQDVLWTFSGVSPVIKEHRASHQHRDGTAILHRQGRAPCVSIFGGKMTTYRKLAEQTLEKLLPAIGHAPAKSWTANAYLPGGDIQNFPEFEKMLRVRNGHLDVSNLHRLACSYGTLTEKFVGNDMGEDFGAGLHQSEIDYLVKHEWAQTAEDILWRRTKLGLHAPEGMAERIENYLTMDHGGLAPQGHHRALYLK